MQIEFKEQRYQMLFRNMINGFALYEMVLDDSGNSVDCVCLEINPAFEKITGISSDEVIGKSVSRMFSGTERYPDHFIRKFSPVVFKGEVLEFEEYDEQLEKYFLIHAFSTGKNRFATILMDVTDNAIARKEMELRDWQLRAIINHSNEVFYVHDSKGNMDFVSPLSTNIFGHSLSSLKNRWNTVATDNPINALGREKTKIALETGIKQEPYILEITDISGQIKYVEIDESPVVNSNGDVTGITGALRDVTNRIEVERERELLQSQLLQSQKMEAVGRLAGGVAHDFNNLMTVVTGYCDILRGKVKDCGDALDDIEEISRAGVQAAQLTRQLLAFSRKQVLNLEVFNLSSEVSSTEKMLRRLIGEDVVLSVQDSGENLLVKADKGQIQQILVNLAVNSRDAMPDGGEITIEIGSAFIDEEFNRTHSCTATGHFVLMTFSDTGAGMNEDTLSKMFEPFFTTKGVGIGTGLGLSTVYGIIKQMGGGIDVFSRVNQGTKFEVYLPVIKGGELHVSDKEEQVTNCRGTTILLTEDDDGVREVVKAMLENSGIRVIEAFNGEMAVKLFKENIGDIDLLLTDVVMPEMGGVELAEEVRRIDSTVKILFMSGYTDNAIQYTDVIKNGFNLIEKPFDINTLTSRISSIISDKSL